jgi:hypothetical protein
MISRPAPGVALHRLQELMMSKEMMASQMLVDRWQLIGRLGVTTAALPGLEAPWTLATRALESDTAAGCPDCRRAGAVEAPARQGASSYPHFAGPAPATHAGGKT